MDLTDIGVYGTRKQGPVQVVVCVRFYPTTPPPGYRDYSEQTASVTLPMIVPPKISQNAVRRRTAAIKNKIH
jgi:hypothetical protein